MTVLAAANQLRRAQSQVIGSAEGDLTRVFRSLDLSRPRVARDALLEAYPAVVDSYGDVASTVSAEWYEDLRRSQVGGTYNARLAPPASAEWSEKTVRWASGDLFTDDPFRVLNTLSGSLTRALGDASRETVMENTKQDKESVGWARGAQPDSCGFCLMLSHRLGIYKRSTADFASHDYCRCVALPSWDSDQPEVPVRAYEASKRLASVKARINNPDLSAKDRAKAQDVLDRHRARTRRWIEINEDDFDDIRAELRELLNY